MDLFFLFPYDLKSHRWKSSLVRFADKWATATPNFNSVVAAIAVAHYERTLEKVCDFFRCRSLRNEDEYNIHGVY